MKYLKTDDGDYVAIKFVECFARRGKNILAYTQRECYLLTKCDDETEAQEMLDTLIRKITRE